MPFAGGQGPTGGRSALSAHLCVTRRGAVAGAIPPQLRELYSSHGLSQMSQISQMSQMSQMSPARLLELNRYTMRPYDLAQQMISQQTAVTKLLSKCTG